MKLPSLSRVLTIIASAGLCVVLVASLYRPIWTQAASSLGNMRLGGPGKATDPVTAVREQIASQLAKPHHADTFIVRYKENTSAGTISSVNQRAASKKQHSLNAVRSSKVSTSKQNRLNSLRQRTQVVQVDPDKLASTMEAYALDPNVEAVYPSYKYELAAWSNSGTSSYPNDFDQTPSASTGDHWYLEKARAPQMWQDQNCPSAGANCGGSSSVVVAIIDTGVAFEAYNSSFEYANTNYNLNFEQSPNLSAMNIWTNSGETYGGGDNDNNGYCDDLHGADIAQGFENFFTNDQTPDFATACASSTDIQKEGHPNDDYGHGTFVTGVVAADIDDGARSLGITPKVTIMPIKANDGPFSPYFYSVVLYDAIAYAVDEGASVINMSIEIDPNDDYLREAIDYAEQNGVPVVIAAGNSNTYISYHTTINTEAIVVGAITNSNQRASYSNYGPAIDLVAGVGNTTSSGNAVYQQTFSCYAAGGCSASSNFTAAGMSMVYSIGTSFAAPQVTAGIAALLTRYPNLSNTDIRLALQYTSVDIDTAGFDNNTGWGVLNLEALWNITPGSYAAPCLYRGSSLLCDTAQNSGTNEFTLNLGKGHTKGDFEVIGDLDNNNIDDFCVYRGGTFLCDTANNGNQAEYSVAFGKGVSGGDYPVIGNVNGTGPDDLCIYRNSNGIFYCDTGNNGGQAEYTFAFGRGVAKGDYPVIGNVNGTGPDDLCIYRAGKFYCDTANNGGTAETEVAFGRGVTNGDFPVLGDLNGDGRDEYCIYRSVAGVYAFHCDTANNGGVAETVIPFGRGIPNGDFPVIGDVQ